MVTTMAVLAAMSPILSVVLLLLLAAWRDRTRESAIVRQIRLTDAIAGELGAIVAPVVTKPLLGPWQVRIAVPFGRPATVAMVVSIANRVLDRMQPGRYEIVLTPQDPVARPAEKPVLPGRRLLAA